MRDLLGLSSMKRIDWTGRGFANASNLCMITFEVCIGHVQPAALRGIDGATRLRIVTPPPAPDDSYMNCPEVFCNVSAALAVRTVAASECSYRKEPFE